MSFFPPQARPSFRAKVSVCLLSGKISLCPLNQDSAHPSLNCVPFSRTAGGLGSTLCDNAGTECRGVTSDGCGSLQAGVSFTNPFTGGTGLHPVGLVDLDATVFISLLCPLARCPGHNCQVGEGRPVVVYFWILLRASWEGEDS